MHSIRAATILVAACAAVLGIRPTDAAPLSYVLATGAVDTSTTDGPAFYNNRISQSRMFGSANVVDYVPPGFSGATSARSSGTVTFGNEGPPPASLVSEGTASGRAGYGSLHGSATATSTVDRYDFNNTASAIFYATWFDTLTFHTGNPNGGDYAYSITLSDSVGATEAPLPEGRYDDSTYVSGAFASTQLLVTPQRTGVVTGISVDDSDTQYGSLDGVSAGPNVRQSPGAATAVGIVHVNDGDVITFEERFYVQAYAQDVNATASAIADDTAFFNLFTLDAGLSYTSASGTVFATTGDPDLGPVVVPPAGGAVPEPSAVALLFAGVGAFLFAGRRLNPGRRRSTLRLGRQAVATATALLASTAMAAPLSYVTNYENTYTQAANGPVSGNAYTADDQRIGAEYDTYAIPGHTQAVQSNSSGTLTHGVDGITSHSTATAAASGSADFGALHGSARARLVVGDVFEQDTTAFARTFSSWYDTLTFHTGAGGADYQYAITLVDTLAATAVNNQVNADAGVSLFVQGGLPLQIYRSTFDGNAGAGTTTLTGFLHVDDGQTVSFYEQFEADAFADFFTSAASAVADDTAYFDLFTVDAGASYSADSGTTYATAGDPDLVSPPPGSVPEPAVVTLLLAGFGGVAWNRRRPAPAMAMA